MSRFLVGATWGDAPHLSPEACRDLEATIPAYQLDARSKGIPQLGAGAIYPIPESAIRIVPTDLPAIPDHWRLGYGMDAGGGVKPTAAAFGAYDPDSDVLYVTKVYKHDSPEPSQHAAAMKRLMGNDGWKMPGVGDVAALIMTEHDREQLIYLYRRLGLDLELPDKSVETGIKEVYDRMILGRFKVLSTCTAFWEEFRLYQRDKHGRIKKSNDHVLDAVRYLVRSGIARMKCRPKVKAEKGAVLHLDQHADMGLGWMGS